MKRFVSIIIFLFVCCVAFSQKANLNESLLVSRVWEIESDEMRGIGFYLSIPKETTIEFSASHTWKSSNPIHGASTGTWVMKSNDLKISMTFGDSRTEYTAKELTNRRFVYQRSGLTARFVTEWVSR
jgi:hypothetical protein